MLLEEYLKLPYTITLQHDDEGDWVARVNELKGCTGHGATQVEALADVEEAKREWIQAALEDGISVPKPEPEELLPSGKWVQRVPRRLHKALTALADAEGTSLTQLVVMILSKYVGASEADQKPQEYRAESRTVTSVRWQGRVDMAPGSLRVLRSFSNKMPSGSVKFHSHTVEEERAEAHAGKR
jgi:antitoxin HicB